MRKAPNPVMYFALAGISALAIGGLLFMEWSSIGGLKSQVRSLQSDMKTEEEVQKELDISTSRLAEIQGRVAHLEKGVPDFRYVPTMLKELEVVGTEHGIVVTGVRPIPIVAAKKKATPEEAKAERRKPYQELAIEIKGRGKFGDTLRFLEALKKFPKVLAARTVTVSPKTSKDADADLNLDMTVELRAYAFREDDPRSKGKSGSETKTAKKEGDRHAG